MRKFDQKKQGAGGRGQGAGGRRILPARLPCLHASRYNVRDLPSPSPDAPRTGSPEPALLETRSAALVSPQRAGSPSSHLPIPISPSPPLPAPCLFVEAIAYAILPMGGFG
ncbi:hypothetical protein PI95_004830 [Hassallia byssoidea VB512170]|uniref:Uncharacterized protein n=1 Tax=Hassallia byssoidea VB512170 TaxID=1304833 RepID=A0A846H3D3_9CYAN|nr:hypothetical protein [Hassalia byssoidea]NEU71916.1 hypothetical protein [Hassalia byssoidea VB512170]